MDFLNYDQFTLVKNHISSGFLGHLEIVRYPLTSISAISFDIVFQFDTLFRIVQFSRYNLSRVLLRRRSIKNCGGPGGTRTSDLTLIRRAL